MSGEATVRSIPWRLLALVLLVSTVVGCSSDGRRHGDAGATSTSSSTSSVVANGPLPGCGTFEGAHDLLADPTVRVRSSARVTVGDLTFAAIAVEGGSDPVLVVRSGNGAWRALDSNSASATGLAEVAGGDENATRAALGAQKAVSCLDEGAS